MLFELLEMIQIQQQSCSALLNAATDNLHTITPAVNDACIHR